VVQSGGTISANNELYIGNENAGASGTYTLSGAGALSVANEVVVGREGGTGTLNVDGGTITTTGNGNMYIGRRNGTGTLNQTAGVISVIKEFGVGTRDDNKIGTGTYNLSGGSLAATNNIFIGKELGASGTMTMTGGTMSTNDKLQIGHNQGTGVLTQSGGTVNVQNEVYIGNENSASSVGTYTLSGSAELNVGNEVLVGRDNGTGTFNLDGGTVTTKKIEGGTGNATVNFNGGILKARESQGAFITNLDVANVQAGGVIIDSNGFDLGISQTLAGAGGLTKAGAGRLTLSASNAYAGTTTVTAGSLFIDGTQASGAVQVDAGATLGGSGAIGGAVAMFGVLSPGNSLGVLSVASLALGGSSTSIFEIDGTTRSTQYDGLNITGSSGPTYGGALSLVFGNGSAFGNTDVFNLFDFTGAAAGDFSSVTSTGFYSGTWSVSSGAWSLQSGGQTLTFSQSVGDLVIVPEPTALALTGIGIAAAAWARRWRR
jgi:autotransporter-associated beta strand protein/T5SS/PEP-CTERM-associated repeat protein